MSKIIILSLGKSGTTSASLFFEKLGYRSLHWIGSIVEPNKMNGMSLDEIIEFYSYLEENYDVFSDYPYCMSYEYFDKKYPGAKFILITRDIKEWVVSAKNHNTLKNFKAPTIASWAKYLNVNNKTVSDLSNKQLEDLYNNHTNDVIKYFSNSKNFIHIDLDDDLKADKIYNFLNISGSIKFPKVNVTKFRSPTEN